MLLMEFVFLESALYNLHQVKSNIQHVVMWVVCSFPRQSFSVVIPSLINNAKLALTC